MKRTHIHGRLRLTTRNQYGYCSRTLRFVLSLGTVFVMLASPSFALENDRIEQGGGIVVYKEREFYTDSLAKAFRFQSADDRRPPHDRSRGYIVFFNDNEQVHLSTASVKHIFLDGAFNDAEKAQVLKQSIQQASKLNPSISQALEGLKKRLASLEAQPQIRSITEDNSQPFPQHTAPLQPTPAVELPDTFLVNGKKYRGAVYQSHDVSRVDIMHESGVASLLIADLSDELQSLFGYNPAAATAAENERQASETRQMKEAIRLAKFQELGLDIDVYIKQVVKKGEIVIGNVARVTDKQKGIDRALGREQRLNVVLSRGDDVWLETSQDDLVGGDIYTGTVYPVGTIKVTEATTWRGFKGGERDRVIAKYTDKLWQAEAYHMQRPVPTN